jgi:hypothetical protein
MTRRDKELKDQLGKGRQNEDGLREKGEATSPSQSRCSTLVLRIGDILVPKWLSNLFLKLKLVERGQNHQNM